MIFPFHHRERGHRHGTEPVVLPTSTGRSRVALPHYPCLVARDAIIADFHAPILALIYDTHKLLFLQD